MWHIADKILNSRLWIGTALYPSLQTLCDAVNASGASVITVSLKREMAKRQESLFFDTIKTLPSAWLPNTAGCHRADDAITTAEMARELFETHWIKLEVIGDQYNLQPDPFELVKAATVLVKRGFEVFPYCTDDLILCQRLVDCGCRILMPWAAPIGSGRGLMNPYALETLRQRLPDIQLIIDAGIGKPSHAVQAMEMGYDGVLLNTAIAQAHDPVKMAEAFGKAVKAGRLAHEAGLMLERNFANPSTPLVDTPFWHQDVAS